MRNGKDCRGCHQQKPPEAWGSSTRYCKACVNAFQRRRYKKNRDAVNAAKQRWLAKNPDYHASWKKKNREKVKVSRLKAHLKKAYGLSLEVFEAMVAAQEGRCKICGHTMSPPHVDHCHRTHRVRGLLCNGCNLAIGVFRDDPQLLRTAAEYLEQSGH